VLLNVVTNGRKVGLPAGTVCDADGTVLGHVFSQNRDAARSRYGNVGTRRFYTANVCMPDETGRRDGLSLGTRYPDRRAALAAIRAFHTSYPASRIAAIDVEPSPYAWISAEYLKQRHAVRAFLKGWDRGF